MFRIGLVWGLFAAVVTPCWPVFTWLKTGRWPSATIADALLGLNMQPPRLNWIGLQKIIDGPLAWPLWVGVSLTCLATAIVCGFFAYVAEEEDARLESLWRHRQKWRPPDT